MSSNFCLILALIVLFNLEKIHKVGISSLFLKDFGSILIYSIFGESNQLEVDSY